MFLFAVPQKASDRLQFTYARVFRWPLAAGHGLTLAARPTTQPKDVTAKEYEDLLANQQQLQNKSPICRRGSGRLSGRTSC